MSWHSRALSFSLPALSESDTKDAVKIFPFFLSLKGADRPETGPKTFFLLLLLGITTTSQNERREKWGAKKEKREREKEKLFFSFIVADATTRYPWGEEFFFLQGARENKSNVWNLYSNKTDAI